MSRLHVFFKCLARSVRHKGLKVLARKIPLGEDLYDIAHECFRLLHEARQQSEIASLIESAAQAPDEEVRREAGIVAAEVAAGDSIEQRQALTAYLIQVPAQIRRTLKRPTDPTGKTVPATRLFARPEALMPMLPARLPRFRPGDHPPGLKDWTLTELLGVGGFGEVWKGNNPFLGDAAFKFCLDADAAVALRNDAQLPARVIGEGDGTGIVRLLDTHLQADPPFLKFEYVPGGDLGGLAHELRGLPAGRRIRTATEVIARLARTVGRFHRLDPPIVHRDLKPANVLVLREPDGGYDLRVADFGIGGVAAGRALEAERQGGTSQGDRLATALRGSHTPLYASREQKDGSDPVPRDDVHALGVIWYQLLVGDLGGEPGVDFADDLREVGVSEGLIGVLRRCITSREGARFADAVEFADAIEEADWASEAESQVGDDGAEDSHDRAVRNARREEYLAYLLKLSDAGRRLRSPRWANWLLGVPFALAACYLWSLAYGDSHRGLEHEWAFFVAGFAVAVCGSEVIRLAFRLRRASEELVSSPAPACPDRAVPDRVTAETVPTVLPRLASAWHKQHWVATRARRRNLFLACCLGLFGVHTLARGQVWAAIVRLWAIPFWLLAISVEVLVYFRSSDERIIREYVVGDKWCF